uniref:Transcription initiation factor tfiid subunit 5 n=1 Tax=Triatoma infestans TaxID=30076 RepID=A0A161MGM2_TRIIF
MEVNEDVKPFQNNKEIKNEPNSEPDKNTLLAVLQVLRKYNLKETEDLLKREAKLTDVSATTGADSEVSNVLSTYKSEGNPDQYEEAYMDLKKFVDGSLDVYKHELG